MNYPREALAFSDLYMRTLARNASLWSLPITRSAAHYEAALRVNPVRGTILWAAPDASVFGGNRPNLFLCK